VNTSLFYSSTCVYILGCAGVSLKAGIFFSEAMYCQWSEPSFCCVCGVIWGHVCVYVNSGGVMAWFFPLVIALLGCAILSSM